MPELPEVDAVRVQLNEQLELPKKLKNLSFSKENLRFPVDKKKLKNKIEGRTLKNLTRHGKYLFFQWDVGILVSHLGMTGHWRIEKKLGPAKKHDHLILEFSDRFLIFNDPRRFGFIVWQSELNLKSLNLGPDALQWTQDDDFFRRMKNKKSPVKSVLLDQKIVAGIGNIYASEILFHARVRPLRHASKIKIDEWQKILTETLNVLKDSMDAGGSSIDDYLHPDGKPGGYQDRFKVYGREKEKCEECGAAIVLSTLGGRSTFWCRRCQK